MSSFSSSKSSLDSTWSTSVDDLEERTQHLIVSWKSLTMPRYIACTIDLLVHLALFFLLGVFYQGSYTDYLRQSSIVYRYDMAISDLLALAIVRCMIVMGTMHAGRWLRTLSLFSLSVSSISFVNVVVKWSLVIVAMFRHELQIEPPLVIHSCLILCLTLTMCQWVLARRFYRLQAHGYITLGNEDMQEDDDQFIRLPTDYGERLHVMQWILVLLQPELSLLLIGFIALVIAVGCQSLTPYIVGKLVDAFNLNGNHQEALLQKYVLTLIAVFFVGAIFTMLRGYVFTWMGHRVVRRLRCSVFRQLVHQDIAFFDETKTGELTSRLSSDTQIIQNGVTVNVSMFVRLSVQVLIGVIILFSLSWKLALIMFSVIPVILTGSFVYGRMVRRLQKTFQDQLASATSIADEVLANMRTVRSCSRDAWASERYSDRIRDSFLTGKKLSMAFGVFTGIFTFASQVAVVLVMWFGGKQVMAGELTMGLLSSFILYTFQIVISMAFLLGVYGDLMQTVGASERIYDLLRRQSSMKQGRRRLKPFYGHISFEHVSFCYPTRQDTPVLRDVSLDLEPGKMIALVGPSGAGKSSIVSLLERFYDLSDSISGRICIDGNDLREVDMRWYRRQIGLVAQEPALFALSIRDNIAFGMDPSSAISDDDIMDAAKKANAHDFITSFPQGYQTLCGEHGVGLSGGQKQRIAIARALLMNPRILILDEATSALDSTSEKLVQEAIDRAMVGRTVLCIAHRLSTVQHADQVIVLHQGQVVQIGRHDELVKQKEKLYWRLVQGQLLSE